MRATRKVVTGPTSEPLTVEEAKEHLNEKFGEQDVVIARIVTAARVWVERATGRVLMPATFDLMVDGPFPPLGSGPHAPRYAEIALPGTPVQSVTHVKYAHPDTGTLTTLVAGTDYAVVTGDFGMVVPAYGTAWPSTRDVPEAVQVRWVAGFGTSAQSVSAQRAAIPAPLLQAMLLLVGHWYANREAVLTGTVSKEIERAVDALIATEIVNVAA